MTWQLFDLAMPGSLACATKQSKHEHEDLHRSPDGQGQAAQGRVLVLLDLVADVGRLLCRG